MSLLGVRLSPRRRRILQALLYETFAVLGTGPVLAWLFDKPMQSTLALALLMSSIALGWNYVFNTLFECWERRQSIKGRSLRRRIAHGIGFESELVLILVPVMAWWLNITLLDAFLLDLGFLAFFFIYTVVFTWVFDRIFGLPQAACA